MGRLLPFLNNSSVHVTDNFTGLDSNTTRLSPLSFWKGSQKKIHLKPQNAFSVDCVQFIIFLHFSPLLFAFYDTRSRIFQASLKCK